MTTTKNNENKKLNFSNEREQSQACLNSAEHEKNQGRKVLNVPNLRFPEFEGEWSVTTLQKDCIVNPTNEKIADKFVYIDLESVTQGQLNKQQVLVKEEAPSRAQRVLHTDDILFQCVRPYQKNNYIVKDTMSGIQWVASTGYAQIRTQIDNPTFLYYVLNTSKYNKAVMVRCTGSSYPAINSEDLSKIPFYKCGIAEQKKIGKFLSLLDERIATQNKIIDRLQTLIKGIVDSTILRKEKNAIVGDVCSISEQIRAEANIDDIITVRLHGNGVCKSSAENLQLGATQYYRRRAGQLIYGKQNFHNGAIGIVPISLDNGITSKDIPSFDIDEMKCNSVYLLAQLQSPQYYKPAEALTTGTGSKRLKEETFLKMPIVLPNKREQDNIATLIISISANLDQAKKMLDLFSIQKQYLLRQMFI